MALMVNGAEPGPPGVVAGGITDRLGIFDRFETLEIFVVFEAFDKLDRFDILDNVVGPLDIKSVYSLH